MKRWMFSLVATVVALSVIGCNSFSPEASTSGSTTSGNAPKSLTVGIVFDSGGRGDKSFNDSAWAGLDRAAKDLNITPRTVESKSEGDYEKNLTALAQSNCDLVVAVGINMETALKAVAPKFENVKFAIVDGMVEAPNVRCLKFKEEEGSFLVGYLAGLMTKTNKIGFVGGQQIDLIKKFECGYEAGARTANPAVTMLPAKYTGDWVNVDLAKTAATVLFSDGADVIYQAAGRAGLGVIVAAGEQKKWAIGVDGDQDSLAKGHVLTSMIKRVDSAVFSTIEDLQKGSFTSGVKVYDLKVDGVGLSPMEFTKDIVGAENIKKVEVMKGKIVAGEVVPPATPDELKTYMAGLSK